MKKTHKRKMMIKFLKGDATKPVGEGNKYITHCCNDIGAWGAGFVMALSRRWPAPKREYTKLCNSKNAKLGTLQIVHCEGEIFVANIIGQKGIHKKGNQVPVRYSAIRKGFQQLKEYILKNSGSVHIPDMIGCGLAGGSRAEMIKIIEEELEDIDVYIYHL